MATILDGLRRGSGRSRNYFDRQTSRRLASEQGAREQTKFEQGQLADQLSASYVRGRDNNWITADPEKGQIGLSDTFKEQLASGDELAQNYAIELVNAGGRGKLPEGFKVDRINQGTDAEGNTVFYVGGINEDGSKGVITTDGTSNDDSIAKGFTPDELFNQTRMAFRSKDGVLYGQRVVDLNDYANSRELIIANTQNPILDGLGSNPAAQRQAAAVIANAATPEEEVEVTNLLAESVGVPPVQLPAEDTSKPETEAAPTDDSAQSNAPTGDKPERATKELKASIRQQVKEAGGSANTQALEYKRLMKEAGYDTFGRPLTSEKPKARNAGRTRGERKFAPLPAVVEEQVAPVVEGKTIAQIDEAIDNGELRVDPETAAAAARDLQEQGVETAADLAKLDPRRQAYAYAMIVASTPNDGNRRAVRDQLINIIETGVSDRGQSGRDDFKAETGRMNAIQAIRTFGQQVRKYEDQNNDDAGKFVSGFYKDIYEDNFDEDGKLTGDPAAVKQLANQYVRQIQARAGGFDTPQARQLATNALNTAVALTVQVLAAEGKSGGIVDSFQSLFRKDVSGTTSYDVSGLVRAGDLIYYREKDAQGDSAPVGEGVSINALRRVDPDLANMIVEIADNNTPSGAKSG